MDQSAIVETEEALDFAEEPPVFPYDILWEEFGELTVKIGDLAGNGADYDLMFEVAEQLEFGTPCVDRQMLRQWVENLCVDFPSSAKLVEDCYVIAGWYLSPKWRAALDTDFQSTRLQLDRVASAAQQLYEALGHIDPKVLAAMAFVRAVEPNLLGDNHPDIFGLGDAAHNLALAAQRVLKDTAPKGPGRKFEFMRDQALRLLISALDIAGCDRPEISDGKKARPEVHFANESGKFILSWFQLLEPKMIEHQLARAAKRVRRSVPKPSRSKPGKQ